MLLPSNGMLKFFFIVEGTTVSCNTWMCSAGRQKKKKPAAFVLRLSEKNGVAKRRLGERGGVKPVFCKRNNREKDFRA